MTPQEVLTHVCHTLGASPEPRLPRIVTTAIDLWVYPSPIVYLAELNTILVRSGTQVTAGKLAHELGHYVLDCLAAHITLTPQVHEIVAGYAEHALVKAGLDAPIDLGSTHSTGVEVERAGIRRAQ